MRTHIRTHTHTHTHTYRERERERERERLREREGGGGGRVERQMDRQRADRKTDSKIGRHTEIFTTMINDTMMTTKKRLLP